MSTIFESIPTVKSIEVEIPGQVPEEVLSSSEPVLLKGLARNWPLVEAGIHSDREAVNYLSEYYCGEDIVICKGEPGIEGRIFYTEGFDQLNCIGYRQKLDKALDEILQQAELEQSKLHYIGTMPVDVCLPGFRDVNDLNLAKLNPLVSIWIGNKSRISAHFDSPTNVACCVVGRRRFTVFPPEQFKNLYVGPLEFTPAGQPISLVDFHNPDFEKYPKFSEALKYAQVAELEAGDALFLPSMWWHHVEGLDNLNILVNYWWKEYPAYLGVPLDALLHSLVAIKKLPEQDKKVWQEMFNHYVFEATEESISHIPVHARGVLNVDDTRKAKRIREYLAARLKRN